MREVKERRRKWAEKLTPRQPRQNKNIEDAKESETPQIPENKGMLPDDIVKLLAANEKYSLYIFSTSGYCFITFLVTGS